MIKASHIGICVSNLDRSTDFYTNALGFEYEYSAVFGRSFERLVELENPVGQIRFFRRDAMRIDLINYAQPLVVGEQLCRPLNQLGLTHLSFIVGDLEITARDISAYGGTVLSSTRISIPEGNLIFCADPDGIRIELWEKLD